MFYSTCCYLLSVGCICWYDTDGGSDRGVGAKGIYTFRFSAFHFFQFIIPGRVHGEHMAGRRELRLLSSMAGSKQHDIHGNHEVGSFLSKDDINRHIYAHASHPIMWNFHYEMVTCDTCNLYG